MGEMTVKYSALSYAYSVLTSTEASAKLVDLVKGLYLYNEAANAFVKTTYRKGWELPSI